LNQTNPTSFALQYNHIINNDNPLDQKSKLLSVADESTYDKVHKHYHPLFTRYSKRFDIDDIMLVNATGDIVYSVSKHLDFATSLISGVYAKYEVGKIFTQVMESTERNALQVSDYIPYIPSYELPSAFICMPIFSKDKKVGAIIFQLSIEQIDKIMTSEKHWQEIGLGNTGESYLVGADQTFRSSSRFFIENKDQYLKDLENTMTPQLLATIKARDSIIGLQQVDTDAVKQAFLAKTSDKQYLNYLGENVIGSYEPLNLYELNWAIICEIGFNEAFDNVHNLARFIFFISLAVILGVYWMASALSLLVAQQISRRINNFAKAIQTIATNRDLTVVLGEENNDELKPIAVSLNKLFKALQETFQDTYKSFKSARDLSTLKQKPNDYQYLKTNLDEPSLANDNDDSLNELSQKLNKLSDQFKFFENEAEKTRDWQ